MQLNQQAQDALSELVSSLEGVEKRALESVVTGVQHRLGELPGGTPTGTNSNVAYYLAEAIEARKIANVITPLAGRDPVWEAEYIAANPVAVQEQMAFIGRTLAHIFADNPKSSLIEMVQDVFTDDAAYGTVFKPVRESYRAHLHKVLEEKVSDLQQRLPSEIGTSYNPLSAIAKMAGFAAKQQNRNLDERGFF